MRLLLKVTFGFVLLCVTAFSLWYYRPWSQYSPAKVAALQDPENLSTVFQNFKNSLPARPLTPSATPRAIAENKSDLPATLTYNGRTLTTSDFIAETTMTGLAVLKDGVLVHEDYYLGGSRTSTHTSWSVAKSFVATAIFMALKEGKIASLDQKAQEFATQYNGTDFGDTSLRALLAMATGMQFDETYSDPNSDINNFFFDSFIKQRNVDSLLFPFQRNRPEFSDFEYISPASQVLSAVLRGIYGKRLNEIISEKIWGPLGMEHDAYWSIHHEGDEGVELGYCCLNATSLDYARFGQFWLEAVKGEGVGVDLLPANVSDMVTKPATPDHAPDTGHYGDRGYSYHFWLPPKTPEGETEFFAVGVYGQYIWIDVKRGIVIARNAADPVWTERGTDVFDFLRAVARHYGGE